MAMKRPTTLSGTGRLFGTAIKSNHSERAMTMKASITELGNNLADIGDRVKRELELSKSSRTDILATVDQLRKGFNEAIDKFKVDTNSTFDGYAKAIGDEMSARESSLDELLNGELEAKAA